MTKEISRSQKAITRDVLVKELSAFERRFESRLDSRLEIQTETLKFYVDRRFSQLDRKIDIVDKKVDKLDKKLEMRTVGLVELIERGFGKIGFVTNRVDDHEKRITMLESRS